MANPYPIGKAAKAAELEAAYATAKNAVKDFGFTATSPLKVDIVKAMMTESKKRADFLLKYEFKGGQLIMDLYCEVPGKGKWTLGRKAVSTKEEAKKLIGLAKLECYANVKKEWGL